MWTCLIIRNFVHLHTLNFTATKYYFWMCNANLQNGIKWQQEDNVKVAFVWGFVQMIRKMCGTKRLNCVLSTQNVLVFLSSILLNYRHHHHHQHIISTKLVTFYSCIALVFVRRCNKRIVYCELNDTTPQTYTKYNIILNSISR